MRFVAFDMGTKRVGVAYSDESGIFAFPEVVLTNNEQLFGNIFDICQKYNPDAFVVGYSDSGTIVQNPILKHIKRFVGELEGKFGLPVVLSNESGTTHSVRMMNAEIYNAKFNQSERRSIKQNDVVDAGAATLLLQRYLDSLPK